jgi:putative hydrolase of the HAD superfamily
LDVAAVRRAASDIFWAHDDMLPILAGLKKNGYRLVLLSNTSISHFNWVREHYRFLPHFDDFVLSYEAGAIKPDFPIYEQALQKIQCDPHECFYTDDIPDYVAAGRRVGLQAEVFQNALSLAGHLRERQIRFE